jgi:hypothetical protein
VSAALLAFVALRALAPVAPGSLLWGVNFTRALPAALGALAWLLPLAAMVAARAGVGSAPASDRARFGGPHPALVWLVAAAAAAALVWVLEDRTRFLGDFGLRTGVLERGADLGRLFPQAMPLDIATHVKLPDWLWRHARLAPDLTQRMLGSMCAALMSIAALDMARTLGARGAVAVAVVATVCAGGDLALFTGYGKGLSELTVLTGVAAAVALRAIRDPRALPALALAVALAIGFHRAGLLLLPFTLVAIALSWRGVSIRRLALTMGILAVPLFVLGPRIAALLASFDLPHHIAPAGPPSEGALDPWRRACDLANAALVLAPLCPLIPALAPTLARSPIGERALLVAWLLSAVALFVVVQPQQGVFRDLDVFAPAAVLLSATAALGIAGWAARRPAGAALAPALTLAALAPTVLWLCVQHWPDRSLPHIEAFAAGPPLRPATERAAIWDFLGTRALAERRPAQAAREFALAAAAAASPRLLYEWGTAEVMQGHLARADSLFRLSVARDAGFAPAWRGLASTASWLGDTLACAQAERRLARLDPAAPELPALRSFLARARAAGGRR